MTYANGPRPHQSLASGGTLGVALDLDAGTISFVSASGASAPASLGLWSFEAIVPAVDVSAASSTSIHLVKSAPFTYAVPPGYVADM